MTRTLPHASRRVLTIVVLALAMIATACGGGTDVAVETPAVPTATSTPAPAPTATPEPEPTATPEPEPTATPEPEPTAEPEPTESEAGESEGGETSEALDDGEPPAEGAETLDPELVAVAEAVWVQSCSGCHGNTGEGTSRGRPLVGIAAVDPAEQHVMAVTDGVGRMPAFADKLTPEEIDAVVTWLRATF